MLVIDDGYDGGDQERRSRASYMTGITGINEVAENSDDDDEWPESRSYGDDPSPQEKNKGRTIMV